MLPVGSIKEKILAAKRAGIPEVMLPVDNKKDVEDIAPHLLAGLNVTYIETLDDAIEVALMS